MDRQALGLHWDLQDDLRFLNHGSFGLAPRELLRWRFELLTQIERDPVAFLVDRLPSDLQESRQALAALIGARAEQLAFVPSTTYGLNELLQRLDDVPPGSEILMLDQGYNATANLARFAADQHGWHLRQVAVPLPLQDPLELVEAFVAAWSPATRVLLLDHITSPGALVLPLAALIKLGRERGAVVLVDGAHGPGSVPLDLEALCPDAYVGNLHKWLCCPRGSAFLWVRRPWQERLRPLVISHGANAPLPACGSRFHLEHDWIGTADPTPWLAVPEALRLLGPDLTSLMERNRRLAQQGQALLLEALKISRLAPSGMQAAMAAIPLPPVGVLDGVALQRCLLLRGFQLPVIPLAPHRSGVPQFLRFSCFAYNTLSDLQELAKVLPAVLAEVKSVQAA